MEPKEFTDMYLVAAIVSYSPGSFERVDKTDRRKQKFYFTDSIESVFVLVGGKPEVRLNPTLEEFQKMYTAGTLMLLPNYAECIKRIKTELHSK